MLAALLCNLQGDAPPPAPVVVQRFFGGGPFWKRYGYDQRYYRQDDEEEIELSEPQAEIVEEAIEQAVQAVRTQPDPEPAVLDAKRLYQGVFEAVRADVRFAEEVWRAELKRRIQEREEEEMIWLLMLS